MTIEAYWKSFLEAKGLDKTTTYTESFYFDLTRESANKLLQLVLDGKKKATSSALLAWNGNVIKEGAYSIVTDFDGVPHCVIQTTNVHILKYKDIDFDLCKKEGEDECLETWQINHKHFFEEEGKEIGFTFSEDLEIVFEEFEVVYR